MGKQKHRGISGSSDTKNPLHGKSQTNQVEPLKTLVFSFKDLDRCQGQCFKEWHEDNLLVALLERLRDISTMTFKEAEGKKFKIYGDFPPADKTDFKHPPQVTADARWASLHLSGLPCIAGHVIGNVFYIVFFDKHHRFWITELKHT